MLEELDKHKHIAFDLDDTLLGPMGRDLVEYIKNHPEKTFSVITNRPRKMANETIRELNQVLEKVDLDTSVFANIVHSPSEILGGLMIDRDFKGKAALEIGATALVDDDKAHLAGCEKNGITFIHTGYKRPKIGLF